MAELAATLLHEMAHLYNLEHGIQDVSNNGYYHNMKFKATAEAGINASRLPVEGELHRFDWTADGTDSPCEAETMRRRAPAERMKRLALKCS